MKVEEINPYESDIDKGEQVARMFDSIAWRYDFMNKVMSLGQYHRWRDKALKTALMELPHTDKIKVLDIATGTGDVAFRLHELNKDALITGIDISSGMLEYARKRLLELPIKEQELIVFGKGDSLELPFHDSSYNLVTVAYGVRNFSDIRKGLREIRRVLKIGGVLCIIELSEPQGRLTKPFYNLYGGKIIPWLGKKITGDQRAYSYLLESIGACPQREDMEALLHAEGFTNVKWKELSFGAVTFFIAK